MDLGNDGSIEQALSFQVVGDTIFVENTHEEACVEKAIYKFVRTDHYVSFELLDGFCFQSFQTLKGYWTRPNYKELLCELIKSKKSQIDSIQNHLECARIYVATNSSILAKANLDLYLEAYPNDIMALLDRAQAKLSFDLNGVIIDANKALNIDYTNQKAWYLKGLAQYNSGLEAEGCADIDTAIEYGLKSLRHFEEKRCAIY